MWHRGYRAKATVLMRQQQIAPVQIEEKNGIAFFLTATARKTCAAQPFEDVRAAAELFYFPGLTGLSSTVNLVCFTSSVSLRFQPSEVFIHVSRWMTLASTLCGLPSRRI
jgi:hypothetical protein